MLRTYLSILILPLFSLYGCVSGPAPVTQTPTDGLTSPTTIHEEIRFSATPHQLYEALTDGKEFALATGAPVASKISSGRAT